MKALIADDDDLVRFALGRLLPEWGYEPLLAPDGRTALGLLEQPDPPRLLILDWTMPDLDGPTLVARVRGRPDGDLFHLLLLTGRSDEEAVMAAMEAGADDYVRKPFDAQELRLRLRLGRRVVELAARVPR